MATANYMTMENFPLFVKEFNTQIKRCPACGLYQDCENDVCEECGEELEEELFFDSIECQELVDDIEWRSDFSQDFCGIWLLFRRSILCGNHG